ncbi:MAG TPA: DNA alkylation repair protein, partial [Anaerolineales bacterium]|nr:DNA alkylation repair protein [Anaerolineales bacterium]
MHPYVRSLKILFEANANPVNAAPMKKYMRDQFEYLGIKSPQVKSLFSGYIKQNSLPPVEDLSTIVRELWNLPQREFQYLAINLLDKMEKKLPEDFIVTL